MPSAAKVSWAQLRVGILAAISLTILAVLIFLLTGNKNLFAKEVTVYTFLDDSAAITEGSAVRLSGIAIGKIGKVALSGENKPNRRIKLDLIIDQDKLLQIPLDSEASIGAENLLGTKYINIKMGKETRPMQPGGELRSLDTREFQDLVNAAYPSLQSLQQIVQRVDNIVATVETGKGSIGKLLVDDELYQRLVGTVAEVQKITNSIGNGKGTVGKLLYDEAMYEDLRSTIKRVDATIADLQTDLNSGKGTAGKLLKDPALYDEVRSTVAELRKTIDEINKGQGTAGKLIKSDELHSNLNKLILNLDKTVDRVNSGQGTLGQLMVNPALYDSMNGTMKEMNLFMKDFRANPKKFLTIQLKLF
ncbi:MAG TPA: MlaD family protein [Bryobacteraceae bacterium]|nr:MlaD family protein [Bryobacteraceae bacterium]